MILINKFQKELAKLSLEQEKAILKEIAKQYQEAMDEINDKIALLKGRLDIEMTPSIINQLNYQNALKGQIGAILGNLQANQFNSIQDYLKMCYEDGFLGVLYDLQGQGIPLIFPIDQEKVIRAIIHDSKISEGLYKKLGHDIGELRKNIQTTVSRGIASNMTYEEISKAIMINGDIYKNKAYRIARTEGHRIQQEATYDSQLEAKANGADIQKVWDATFDRRTRRSHAELDGKAIGVNENFEYNGHTAKYPGGFGVASLDINCRCVIIQRAKWAIDDDITKFDGKTGELITISSKNYQDFKTKYFGLINKD